MSIEDSFCLFNAEDVVGCDPLHVSLHRCVTVTGPRYDDPPRLEGLDLPPLGIASRPTPLVTKTLLFIGDGSNVFGGIPELMIGRKFRALDKATGEVLWETELPAAQTGGPMTYLVGGKQFIVVPIGERDQPSEWVALALP